MERLKTQLMKLYALYRDRIKHSRVINNILPAAVV